LTVHTFKNLVFVGEKSEYIFNCAMCWKQEIIESEDPNSQYNIINGVNIAAVTASVNSGQGYV